MNALFYGTVQATEEAILNAMLAATTMTGAEACASTRCLRTDCWQRCASTDD